MSREGGDIERKTQQRIHQHHTHTQVGDGAKTVFYLPRQPGTAGALMVFVDGKMMAPTANAGAPGDYTWDGGNKVTFAVAPANTKNVVIYAAVI